MTRRPHPVDIHVGKKIRELRCYAGLTQTALAQSVGISFQQLQKYEEGVNRVSASRLWDIAGVLGTPVADFFPVRQHDTRAPPLVDPDFETWMRLYREASVGRRLLLMETIAGLGKDQSLEG